MARMLDRENRVRVIGIALLAVAVMVGVVASALVAKSHAGNGGGERETVRAKQTGPRPTGKPRRGHDIPDDCKPDPKAPPVLRLEGLEASPQGPVLDLGAAKQGVMIDRVVTLRNAGTGDLCVLEPTAGCGCVKVVVAGATRVKPGETTTIRITVDTANKEGLLTKEISVWSNDPANRETKFILRVDVRLGIVADKSMLYFGRHAVGKSGTDVLRLRSPKADAAWTVTRVEGARRTYTFEAKEVEPADPDFRHVEVKVTHPPHGKAEHLDDQVTIHTTHPDRPTVAVRANMMVMDRVYAAPQRLAFGFVGAKAAPVQRQAYVMAAEPEDTFTLKDVRIDGTGFEVLGEPKKSQAGWVIEVRYDGKPRGAGTAVEATLVIDVELPDTSLEQKSSGEKRAPIKIPISATVR
jgi:hypothetical protein